jgi:hypothetical protein
VISFYSFADEVCQIKLAVDFGQIVKALDPGAMLRGKAQEYLKTAPWMAGAALLGGTMVYLGSRTDKKTGKSLMEQTGEKLVEMSQRKAESEKSYNAKLRGAFARTFLDVAHIAKAHPVRAALSAAMLTAPLGKPAANISMNIKKNMAALRQAGQAVRGTP